MDILLHHLLGQSVSESTDEYEINLGTHEMQDFTLDICGVNILESLDINITNAFSLKLTGREDQFINNLRITSIDGVLYNGGVKVENLEIYAPKYTVPGCLNLTNVTKATMRPFNEAFRDDLNKITDNLDGVCFGHGTGHNVLGVLSNSHSSIDDISETLPKSKWLNFFVSWIGSSLDISNLKISPCLNSPADREQWGNIAQNTETIKRFSRSYYDNEILETMNYAKSKDFLLCFTPSLLIDRDDKPWRGFITGNPEEIRDFYNSQYKPFILHYANLVGPLVDAFILGSELKSLTAIQDTNKDFPFVKCLIDLARQVKGILPSVNITYCANWDEYHHFEGGYRPLDDLWSSPYIDMVGISMYSPITEKTNSSLSSEEVIQEIKAGADRSYWTDANGAKHDLDPQWNIKNIEHWWFSNHWSNGVQTSWEPKMKKIWFMEFGFASIDKSTNAPNRYFSPGDAQDSLPDHSTAHISISHLIKAYAGFLNNYANHEMIENKFAYLWDARGRNWHLKEDNFGNKVYPDGDSWYYSHGLEGKIKKTEEEYEN